MTCPEPVQSEAGRADERDTCRQFAQREVAPHANSFDREECVPREIIDKIAAKGYLGAVIPSEYGGGGVDMVSMGILHEEMGQACSSVRSLLTVHSMVSYAILRWGTQHLRDCWLPKLANGSALAAFALTEPKAGSDARSIATTASRSGASYFISGTKKWITFGQIADIFLVFAQCDGGLSAFLVETESEGVSAKPIGGMLGMRGSMLAEIEMSNAEVPKENLVGGVGFGLAAVGGVALDLGRYSVACGSVGISQACLNASLEYAETRTQFGNPIRDHQLISRMITRMATDTEAGRQLYLHAGRLKDNGDPETITATLMAKYFAARAAAHAASDAVQIHGANGCGPDNPVQRYFRDAKIMEIIEGSNQIQEVMIAKRVFDSRGGIQ